MTNSLIELYGGGMVGKSNNYQLGGRIASARRGREYQKEMRKLREAAERAAKRQRRASGLGSILSTVGGLAGSLIPIPGVGTAVGSALGTAIGSGLGRLAGESTYKDTKVEGGKYAQESRRDVQASIDDFRRSMGERALAGGIKAGLMKFASEGGADYLKAKFGPSPGLPTADIPELEQIEGGLGFETPRRLVFNKAAAFVDPSPYIPFQDMPLSDISATELGDFSSIGLPPQYPLDAYRSAGGYGPFQNRGGGLIDYTIPKMQAGGMALPEEMMNPTMGANLRRPNRPPIGMPSAPSPVPPRGREGIVPKPEGFPTPTSPIGRPMAPTAGANLGQIDSVAGQDLTPDLSGTDFSGLQGLSGTDIVFGGDPIFGSDTDWSMTGSNLFGVKGAGAQVTSPTTTSSTATSPTGSTTLSAPIGGYGSAIGAVTALSQMGMGDVATDPRLQEYLEDLPQFSQGYRQQFGDIQRSGRQALQQLYAAQRLGGGAAGGFAGAGAGGQAFQQQLGGLRSDIGRQRRGVVEGFQSDLLSAISDIEAKGEFEFGTSGGFDPVADIMAKNPSLTIEEAEELHSQNVDAYYDQQYG